MWPRWRSLRKRGDGRPGAGRSRSRATSQHPAGCRNAPLVFWALLVNRLAAGSAHKRPAFSTTTPTRSFGTASRRPPVACALVTILVFCIAWLMMPPAVHSAPASLLSGSRVQHADCQSTQSRHHYKLPSTAPAEAPDSSVGSVWRCCASVSVAVVDCSSLSVISEPRSNGAAPLVEAWPVPPITVHYRPPRIESPQRT